NKKFTSYDNLIDKLYKYTRFLCMLHEHNTPENTKAYKRLNSYKKCYTYIWDQKGSLDDFVKDWIPSNILNTLKNHYNSNSNKVKIKIEMRIGLDFHKCHGKSVGSFCFVIMENVFVRIDFI